MNVKQSDHTFLGVVWGPKGTPGDLKTAETEVVRYVTGKVNTEVSIDLYAMPFGKVVVLDVRHL